MNCSICDTPFGSRGQATCASCARALIYQARLNHLTDLLARESLHKTVSSVVAPPYHLQASVLPSGSDVVNIAGGATKHQHLQVLGDVEALERHCALVDHQLSLLRKRIDDAREARLTRKDRLERRRADVASERQVFELRMPQLLGPLQANIDHLHRKLDKVQSRTRDGRVKLCHETARLAGLQQRRRKSNRGQIVEDYIIGCVPIPDLRQLHMPNYGAIANRETAARPEQVTAALANICRLLTTACHYLSIRLPAEITPAHVNYPHPTIFSIQSSYQGFQLPFPGSASSHLVLQNPSASRRLETRSLPKLRLLHLDKPLVKLAREDPVVYNLFVEGVTLLAWNVAWLCRSQGLPIANTLDDVSSLGKNLYVLFRRHAAMNDSSPLAPDLEGESSAPGPAFGHLSHADSQANIEGPIGIAHMRNWRVASPHRVIDSVKKHLLAEMSGDEWDLIADSEWDNDREDEKPVLVGGARSTDADKAVINSITASNQQDEVNSKGKGSSGWMKLKSRGGDVA